MQLNTYLNTNIKPLEDNATFANLQNLFRNLSYSHFPITKNGTFVGCIQSTDAECMEVESVIKDFAYLIEPIFVKEHTHWLDIFEGFIRFQSNILPVLNAENKFIGFVELNDMLEYFNQLPIFSEKGAVLVVKKSITDFSMSEICQIVESNDRKILGAFVSQLTEDKVEITIKLNKGGITDIIQTFRRYDYSIELGHQDDSYLKTLKERSNYLTKYLDI